MLDNLFVLGAWWMVFVVWAGPRYGEALALVWVALDFTYFFLCEVTTGQTVGKRIAGLRVVSLQGGLPSVGQAATRTVLRLVDQGIILLGLLVTVGTGGRRQRIGDLLAGTAVARAEDHPVMPRPVAARTLAYPLAWMAAAVVVAVLWADGRLPGSYRDQADAACAAAYVEAGPRPSLDVLYAAYGHLRYRLAMLEPPGNWAARHDVLVRNAAQEHALVLEVWRLSHAGRSKTATRRWRRLAELSRTHNAALAADGFRDCAGERS